MPVPDFRLAAARHRLDLLSAEEMIQWADDLLAQGMYTYSLGELATSTEPLWWETTPRFRAALRELSVTVPSEEEAANVFVSRCIEDIAEQRQESLAAVMHFAKHAPEWGAFGYEQNRVLTAHPGYQNLIGFYYAHEEIMSVHSYLQTAVEECDRAIRELACKIVSYAQEWIVRRYKDDSFCAMRSNEDMVREIARSIHDQRRYTDLPILAVALEEVGCTCIDVLEHCHRAEDHPNGCWVIDLLLREKSTEPSERLSS